MTKNPSDDVTVNYTVKEIVKSIHEQVGLLDEKLDAVHLQTLATNGRVTRLEHSSVGFWAKTHVIKFTLLAILLLGVLISDIRHPLWELIKLLLPFF